MPIGFSLSHVSNEFISYGLYRGKRYFFGSLPSLLEYFFLGHWGDISDNFALGKAIDWIFNVGIEINYSNHGIWSFILYVVNVMGNTNFNYLLSRNILIILLLFVFALAAQLSLTLQLLLECPRNISYGLSRFYECLNTFKIFNHFLFSNCIFKNLEILWP